MPCQCMSSPNNIARQSSPTPTVDPYNYMTSAKRKIDVYAGSLEWRIVYDKFPLITNQNYPKNKPQEQYGNGIKLNQQNQAIFFPIQFTITDRGGRTLKSLNIAIVVMRWEMYCNFILSCICLPIHRIQVLMHFCE